MNLKTPNILPNCSMIFSVLRSGANVKRLPGSHECCINKTIKRFFQMTNLLVPNIWIFVRVIFVTHAVPGQIVVIDIWNKIYKKRFFQKLILSIGEIFLVMWQILIHSSRLSIFLNVFKCSPVIFLSVSTVTVVMLGPLAAILLNFLQFSPLERSLQLH